MILIHEWGCDICHEWAYTKWIHPLLFTFYYMTSFWKENNSGHVFVLSCTLPLISWVQNKIKVNIPPKKSKKTFLGVLANFTIFLKNEIGQARYMILLYNGSHHIPTGGFIYDFYSRGIIRVIIYFVVINICMVIPVFSSTVFCSIGITHIPECSINSSSRHSKFLPHVLGWNYRMRK